ncbi:hypothetical protein AB6A23_05195 [Paenibacillus tarimensis]
MRSTRKWMAAAMLSLIIFASSACESVQSETGTENIISPENSTGPNSNIAKGNENDQARAIPEQLFDKILALSPNHWVSDFEVLNENEIVAVIQRGDTSDRQIVSLNMKSGEETLLWEGETFRVDLDGVMEEQGDSEPLISFQYYDLESSKWYMEDIEGGKLVNGERLYQTKSPDGKWLTVTDNGIWGISAETGMKVRWTPGEDDSGVLWLPDSSGFVFLQSTGEQLGDGAGPAYELAHFQLDNRKITAYSLAKGFWGGIEWLDPGKTILVHNGFDDMIGLKIVDLDVPSENQVLLTEYADPIGHAFSTLSNMFVVSKSGEFTVMQLDGTLVKRVPWPADLDEYTQKNPSFSENNHESKQPYYEKELDGGKVGPYMLQFSPDGKHLAFLLGAVGESSDDRVPGTKIIICNLNTGEAEAVTQEYLRIDSFRWSPGSDQIAVIYALPEERSTAYLGVKNIK